MATINNEWYETQADQWWQHGSGMDLLHAFNPGRLRYLDALIQKQKLKAGELEVLDVGCGGGFLAEALAKKGFTVSGVDPSPATIDVAKRHASDGGLDIRYKTGPGEALPFDTDSFDIVTCCDVLEHVTDLDQVVAEISRVLKPGGIFFYDTINRTALSWLILIKFAQDIPFARSVPEDTHLWRMFIKPEELRNSLEQSGLTPKHECGLGPRKLIPLAPGFIKYKLGKISAGKLGENIEMGSTRLKSLLYMGWAVKA